MTVEEVYQEAINKNKADGAYIECVIVTQKNKDYEKKIKYYFTCPITPGAIINVSNGEAGQMVYMIINLLDKDKNFVTNIYRG